MAKKAKTLKGKRLRNKKTGRVITVKHKTGGMGHWMCDCGGASHHIHEGTLRRYYEEVHE